MIPTTDIEIDLINNLSRRTLSTDEVYAFPLILCDNDIDRDFECFSKESLEALQPLFVGKTGIFDHNPKGSNQTARIYKTQVCNDPTKQTATGQAYFYLKAWAYIVRCEKNNDLILEIDAGIKKEVSVGCKANSAICSICGQDSKKNRCSHIAGTTVEQTLCYYTLEQIEDAYEWSFVAVPAQVNAGITKHFKERSEKFMDIQTVIEKSAQSITLSTKQTGELKQYLQELQALADVGKVYKEQLKQDVVCAYAFSEPTLSMDIIKSVTEKMSFEELLAYQKSLKSKTERPYLQLATIPENANLQSDFKM